MMHQPTTITAAAVVMLNAKCVCVTWKKRKKLIFFFFGLESAHIICMRARILTDNGESIYISHICVEKSDRGVT